MLLEARNGALGASDAPSNSLTICEKLRVRILCDVCTEAFHTYTYARMCNEGYAKAHGLQDLVKAFVSAHMSFARAA